MHTHYDAQAFWDRTLSPSCYHGVTTVIAGNCGFSIAPLNGKPEDSEYLMRMLARVEGMPLESLREGVPWNWRSFGEYLDALDGKLAINAGFMVGHSALRRDVMGARAVGSHATGAEIAAMQELLRESIAAGGLGFSSTVSPTHNDADGKPVPSRHATDEELFALAGVVSEFPGTLLELLPGVGNFTEAEKERMTKFALAGQRAVNWNLLSPSSMMPELHKAQLAASDYAAERGATVIALTLPQPTKIRLNLVSGFVIDALPGWAEVIGKPLPERKAAFADPAVRAKLDAGAHSPEAGVLAALANWATWMIEETFEPANKPWQGRTVGELAAAQGKTPFDALLDLVAVRGPAHLLRAADHRRRRRVLAHARRGLERPAHRDRRLRRRRAPRHDRHLRLLDAGARARRARARPDQPRGGRAPADRGAGAHGRAQGAGPAARGLPCRRGGVRRRTPSPAARPTRASTCPAAPAACTRRPMGVAHVIVNGARSCATAPTPARRPARSCARAATPPPRGKPPSTRRCTRRGAAA